MSINTRSIRLLLCAVAVTALSATTTLASEDAPPKLTHEQETAIAERIKSLAETAPKGARLVAFLDCGVQAETAKDSPVAIKKLQGETYTFLADEVKVPATQPTVFYDADRVLFELSGIERTGRYLVGLTWWDFDAGGRAQMVVVSSPNRRYVRIAIPAIGLPSYKNAKKLPAEKQFTLPATFAKEGKMQLAVGVAGGPNAVISELWIWQLEK